MLKKCFLFTGILGAIFCSSLMASPKVVVVPSGSKDKQVTVNPPGNATTHDVLQGYTFSSQEGIGLSGALSGDTPQGDATVADVVTGITFSKSNTPNLVGTFIPAKLPKTGQTSDLLPGLVQSGTDGFLEIGEAWPTTRFTDNNDGTVTDNLTSLTWLKNAGCINSIGYEAAFTTVADMSTVATTCGLTGTAPQGNWRVPNIRELTSLISYAMILTPGDPMLPVSHPFTNVNVTIPYWTSTTMIGTSNYTAFGINFSNGAGGYNGKSAGSNYPLWAVK